MATIKKRGNSYLIRCYAGYRADGKQIEKTMTWNVPAGMSTKRAEKEALHEAELFEERVRNGQIADGRMKFSDYAQKWFSDYAETQLRPRTIAFYKGLMSRVEPALGHVYLDKLRPAHLMDFYKELSTVTKAKSYVYKGDFKTMLKARKMTQEAFSAECDISKGTVYALAYGHSISATSAEKVSKYLSTPLSSLFLPDGEEQTLSGKTILHYHHLLSSMLHTAVEWQLIPENPALRVQPPKAKKYEALFLDDKQAIHLLELLENEPFQYKAAVEVLLFTGMRRAELLGLNWEDIDFEHGTININKSSLYLPGKGVFEDDTKNNSSCRVIKAPATVFDILSKYRVQQLEQRMKIGSAWQNSERVFTTLYGAQMYPDALSNWFHRFILRTDLPQIHLHSLRHTNATLQIANGVSVTTVAGNLGHANANTTTKIYAHAIQSAAAASAEIVDNLLNPGRKQA